MRVRLEVKFDSRVFSLDSVKKAAYRYIDKFSIDIGVYEDQIICGLSFLSKVTPEGAAHLLDEFKKEVLDQDLRKTIAAETEGVRNLILAHAFSKTSLVTSNG